MYIYYGVQYLEQALMSYSASLMIYHKPSWQFRAIDNLWLPLRNLKLPG